MIWACLLAGILGGASRSAPLHAQCPQPDGSFAPVGFYTRVDLFGDLALVWDLELRRVTTVRIAPEPVAELGTWESEDPGDVADVALFAELGVVVGPDRLHVLDVTDPTQPMRIGALTTIGSYERVDVFGTLAAVWDLELRRIDLVDLSDPTAPMRVGEWPVAPERTVHDLTLWNGTLFVSYGDTLEVVDVSDLAAPARRALLLADGFYTHLSAAGDLLVVVDEESRRWVVFDIMDPENPVDAGNRPVDVARDIAVFPCRALVLEEGPGDTLQIFDLAACAGCRDFCIPDPQTLCLNEGRFRVRGVWKTSVGTSGPARAVPLTADTGYFWFFSEGNVEVVVKVLDACSFADRFWVFAAGLTNVDVELGVEDTQRGAEKLYDNPLGRPFVPILDTDALATCP